MTARVEVMPQVSLSMEPAGAMTRRIAIGALILIGVAFVVLAPFARTPVAATELFLPVYQSAQVLCDLVTAMLLFGQFVVARWKLLLVLAGGYIYNACVATFQVLSFPGLFSDTGLLGAGSQTAEWLYFFWHMGFPVAVIGYAWFRDRNPLTEVPGANVGSSIALTAIASLGAALMVLLLATLGHDLLPVIMIGNEGPPAKDVVAWMTWLMTLSALPILWRHASLTTLDLWLIVVIAAWACDIAQTSVFNAGRFSLGWYVGRLFGLLSSSFLLVMLIMESGRLYRRLADSFNAERKQRRLVEERTAQMDALNESLERRVIERTAALEFSNEELRLAREELKELGRLAATAREQERARIARDIHDELGQLLVLVKDQIWEIGELLDGDDAGSQSRLARISELVDLTITTTKRIAVSLRPDILDILGLGAAVDWLIDAFGERSGIQCRLDMDPPDMVLQEPWATVVFRLIQESLTNVARHAEATRVEISLRLVDEQVELLIADNGRGFDVSEPRDTSAFGLVGMRERVYLVSGDIDIDSAPGRGTAIRVTIPVGSGD